MEECKDWDLNGWDEYEIDTWDLKQELMGRFYEIFPTNDMEETGEDKEEARRLSEEEEDAKIEHFRELEE